MASVDGYDKLTFDVFSQCPLLIFLVLLLSLSYSTSTGTGEVYDLVDLGWWDNSWYHKPEGVVLEWLPPHPPPPPPSYQFLKEEEEEEDRAKWEEVSSMI